MYQAIVFLPLLGAILAGLIALAGARARFPGAEPAAGRTMTRPTMPCIITAAAHGGASSITPRRAAWRSR